jgi:flavin reductase (DIM6/NTAB) family NADH-FMN oxidoreductase RutF
MNESPSAAAEGFDALELRRCFSRFATGVTIVTFATPEGPRGLTVNSFTSVSMRPPLVMVSIDRRARAHDHLARESFTVNVLGSHQESLARQFAGQSPAAVPWDETAQVPRLHDALAWIECRPWRGYAAGDHTLFLGQVERFFYGNGDALGFYCGKFLPLTNLAAPAP